METLNKYLATQLFWLKKNGFLAVLFALLSEALLIGFLAFLALFSLETLLPTFVTARFSLTKFLFFLMLLTFFVSCLGRFLSIHYTWTLDWKQPWVLLGIAWMCAIIALSLFKFPLLFIALILLGFLLTGFLLAKIFLEA